MLRTVTSKKQKTNSELSNTSFWIFQIKIPVFQKGAGRSSKMLLDLFPGTNIVPWIICNIIICMISSPDSYTNTDMNSYIPITHSTFINPIKIMALIPSHIAYSWRILAMFSSHHCSFPTQSLWCRFMCVSCPPLPLADQPDDPALTVSLPFPTGVAAR